MWHANCLICANMETQVKRKDSLTILSQVNRNLIIPQEAKTGGLRLNSLGYCYNFIAVCYLDLTTGPKKILFESDIFEESQVGDIMIQWDSFDAKIKQIMNSNDFIFGLNMIKIQ